MCNHNQDTAVAVQVLLQPEHHIRIKMVGRLIEDQDICRIQQGPRQRDAFLLAAGQVAGRSVVVAEAQFI